MHKLRKALDQVHAQESTKKKAMAYVSAKRKRMLTCRRLAPVAVCLALVILGGCMYFPPTAYVSVDVNPSLELGINRFDRVVSVRGRNAEGEILADQLDLTFRECAGAVDTILQSRTVDSLLSRDGQLTITVVGDNVKQAQRLLQNVQDRTADRKNTHCYSASQEELDHAHHMGLSYGKYRIWLELCQLDPDITLEQIRHMSMGELQDLMNQLSEGDAPEAAEELQTEAAEEPAQETLGEIAPSCTEENGYHHGHHGGKHG